MKAHAMRHTALVVPLSTWPIVIDISAWRAPTVPHVTSACSRLQLQRSFGCWFMVVAMRVSILLCPATVGARGAPRSSVYLYVHSADASLLTQGCGKRSRTCPWKG